MMQVLVICEFKILFSDADDTVTVVPARDELRKEREGILQGNSFIFPNNSNANISTNYGVKECNSLLKKFENRKFAAEYQFFSKPVSTADVTNYSIFVKRPMDFSTIKNKLERLQLSLLYYLFKLCFNVVIDTIRIGLLCKTYS